MSEETKNPSTISFDYIKANNFRIVHVDGAFMAGAPQGLTISLYSERQPIPRRVVHKIGSNNQLGEEIVEQRLVRDALIRDVEVSLALSIETAKNIHDTLGNIIKQYEEVINVAAKQGTNATKTS
jgi:hypothetical protein